MAGDASLGGRGSMFGRLGQLLGVFTGGDHLRARVIGKTMLVVVTLLLLWALKDKDVVVVYMRF
jgi:hypothetical protein